MGALQSLGFRTPAALHESVASLATQSRRYSLQAVRYQTHPHHGEGQEEGVRVSESDCTMATPFLTPTTSLNYPLFISMRSQMSAPLAGVLGPVAASELMDRTLQAAQDPAVMDVIGSHFEGFSLRDALLDHNAHFHEAWEADGEPGVERAASVSFQRLLPVTDQTSSQAVPITVPLVTAFLIVVVSVGLSIAASGTLSVAATYLSTGISHAARAFSFIKTNMSASRPSPSFV